MSEVGKISEVSITAEALPKSLLESLGDTAVAPCLVTEQSVTSATNGAYSQGDNDTYAGHWPY